MQSGGKATISTDSNASVHEIGTAIHQRRQAAGAIGADKITIHGLALTEGDRVRVRDRLHDAETKGDRAREGGRAKVLANNGDVVTIREIHQRYMVVENAKGDVGAVLWSKTKNGLAYGYSGTAHLMQGVTSENHVHAPLDGTRSANAFSAYVGMSRHKDKATLVLNEAAIRREISKTRMAGVYQPISQDDIWLQAGKDVSRQPLRGSATEMLSRVTERRRGTVRDYVKAMDAPQRQEHDLAQTQFQRIQLSHVVNRVMHFAMELRQTFSQAVRDMAREVAWMQPRQTPSPERQREAPEISRGPSMGMGR